MRFSDATKTEGLYLFEKVSWFISEAPLSVLDIVGGPFFLFTLTSFLFGLCMFGLFFVFCLLLLLLLLILRKGLGTLRQVKK